MKIFSHNTIFRASLALAVSTPALSLAASRTLASGGTFSGVVDVLVGYINQFILVIVALALVVFFWGMAKFILKAGESAEHAKGAQLMLWGIIGLFIMGSLWGIIAIIAGSFFV